jgi:hypothetical protein
MKFQTDAQSVEGIGGTPESNSNAERYAKSQSGNMNNVTRHINCCLVSCDQCSGLYIDSIRGDILRIICHHQCHSTKQIANLPSMSKRLEVDDSKTGMSAR